MLEEKEVQDLISVIVPVYNIMDCLPKCVDSICNQTYQNLEIILVDDGSDDGTEKLVDELALKDERIRVFHKKNGGSSSARNLAIDHANGKWFGFVDSDDFIDPKMYEHLIKCAKEYQVPMVQTSRDEIDDKGNKLPDVCMPPEETFQCESTAFIRELLLHRGDSSFCTKLTDRNLFERHRFPEGVLNEDFYLLVQMLQEIEGVVIIPEQYYHVYYRIGSNTRKKSKNDFSRVYTDIVNNADMMEEIVQDKYPELREEAVRFGLFQRLDYLLHIPLSEMKNENKFYQSIKKYLHRHIYQTVTNPYLTKKNKTYLLLLTIAPKTVRWVHSLKMKK